MEFDFDSGVKVFSSEVEDGSMSLFDGSFAKNSPKFLAKIGCLVEIVFCEQYHGDEIKLVKNPGNAGKCDGAITLGNFALGVRTADCVPIMILDNDRIGAIHCGRKSLTGGIIESLKPYFASPESAKIFLAPHIRAKNYSIKQDLVDELAGSKWEKFIVREQGKIYFDLTRAVVFALAEIGVKEENVIDSGIDAYADSRFFSARRDPQDEVKTFVTVIFKNGSH